MKAVLDDDSSGLAEAEDLRRNVARAIAERSEHDLRRGFADLLDTVHTSPSAALPSGAPSAAELEEERRLEAEVRAALSRKVSEALSSQGISVVAVLDDGTGGGWTFHARDGVGRPYSAALSFAAGAADDAGDDGLVDRLAGSVVRALLAERGRYFRRMTS